MHQGRYIFGAVLALVAPGAMAATTPVLSTDFTLADPARVPSNWTLNGSAKFDVTFNGATPVVQPIVSLTQNRNGQLGAIWTNDTYTLPSFTMYADVNVDFHPVGAGVSAECPADGFALAFANSTTPNTNGSSGGGIGLYGNDAEIPQFVAAEVNTWYGNSIDDTSTCTTGKNVTFEFSNIDSSTGTGRSMGGTPEAGGAFVGQVTAPDSLQNGGFINGGWFRLQWDVDTASRKMDLYITGLDDTNKKIQNLKVAEVTFAASAPPLNFKGRFGLTSGTGGGTEGLRVRQVVVFSPAVPGGTALPSATAGP